MTLDRLEGLLQEIGPGSLDVYIAVVTESQTYRTKLTGLILDEVEGDDGVEDEALMLIGGAI